MGRQPAAVMDWRVGACHTPAELLGSPLRLVGSRLRLLLVCACKQQCSGRRAVCTKIREPAESPSISDSPSRLAQYTRALHGGVQFAHPHLSVPPPLSCRHSPHECPSMAVHVWARPVACPHSQQKACPQRHSTRLQLCGGEGGGQCERDAPTSATSLLISLPRYGSTAPYPLKPMLFTATHPPFFSTGLLHLGQGLVLAFSQLLVSLPSLMRCRAVQG